MTDWRLNCNASLSVNIDQCKDLSLMVCAFLINAVNDDVFSCVQDTMKGRRVYFDLTFACEALNK